jgi:hypothetical protein
VQGSKAVWPASYGDVRSVNQKIGYPVTNIQIILDSLINFKMETILLSHSLRDPKNSWRRPKPWGDGINR